MHRDRHGRDRSRDSRRLHLHVRGRGTERSRRLDTLTRSQREAFELAREEGYYRWPREVSTRELAAEMDISKTTLLEHLRKAESKLLDPQ